MARKISRIQILEQNGGSTVDDMLNKMDAWQKMSDDKRDKHVADVIDAAISEGHKMSEDEYALMMAADGYFEDEGY